MIFLNKQFNFKLTCYKDIIYYNIFYLFTGLVLRMEIIIFSIKI